MKKIILVIFLLVTIVGFSQGKIRGFYDSKKRVFVEYNAAFGIDSSSKFKVEPFTNGQAVVKEILKLDKYNTQEKFGIIDTAGNIVVPIVHEFIERLFGKRDDIFHIRKVDGSFLYQMGKGYLTDESHVLLLAGSKFTVFGPNPDYILLKDLNRFGLFHIPSKKVVLQPLAEDNFVHFPKISYDGLLPITYVKDDLFYIHANDTFTVYNFKSAYKSRAYRSIRPIGKKTFELIDLEGKRIFTDNLESMKPLSGRELIDGFNDHFIIEENGQFGLLNENLEQVVAPKYDDILFVSYKVLAVKKGTAWAFMDYSGKETTAFEFFDLEKTNSKVVDDIKLLTMVDTAKFDLYKTDYKFPYENETQDVIDVLRAIDWLAGSKRLFPTIYGPKSRVSIVAHHISGTYLTYEGETTSSRYDEIYHIPKPLDVHYMRLGKKYGYLGKDIRYDGCFYDIDHVFYNHGSHYFIIKNKMIAATERTYNSLTKSWQETLDVKGKEGSHVLYIYETYAK